MKNAPFKFLDAYQKEDADIFFGREKDTENLYNALSGVKHLLVYGASGCGKTSLVECGLRNQFSDADWFALTIRKGSNINVATFAALNNVLEEKIPLDNTTKLPIDTEIGFEQAVEQLFAERYQPIYLLFDQFEELLISGDKKEQVEFFKYLYQLIRYRVPCRVLLIMREEFIGHLSEFEPFFPTIFQNRFRVEKMRKANVQNLIAQILDAPHYRSFFSVTDSNALAAAMLDKLPDQVREIELAHVQVFLSELWERAAKDTAFPVLNADLVQTDDNLERILDSFLKKQIKELDQRYGAKLTLEVLATMISERYTKLQMSPTEIVGELHRKNIKSPANFAALLDDLIKRRILRPIKTDDQNKYEISHDTLALVVGSNFTQEMKLRQQAEEVYKLYTARNTHLSQDDINYLQPFAAYLPMPDRLKTMVHESKKRLKQRRQTIAAIVITVLAIMTVLTLWALQQQGIAEQQKTEAQANLKNAYQSEIKRYEREQKIAEDNKAFFERLNAKTKTIQLEQIKIDSFQREISTLNQKIKKL